MRNSILCTLSCINETVNCFPWTKKKKKISKSTAEGFLFFTRSYPMEMRHARNSSMSIFPFFFCRIERETEYTLRNQKGKRNGLRELLKKREWEVSMTLKKKEDCTVHNIRKHMRNEIWSVILWLIGDIYPMMTLHFCPDGRCDLWAWSLPRWLRPIHIP